MPLSSSKDYDNGNSDQSKNSSNSSSDTYYVFNDSEITTRGIKLIDNNKF